MCIRDSFQTVEDKYRYVKAASKKVCVGKLCQLLEILKGMGENLRKIAMHVTNEFVKSAVNTNFENGIAT